PRPRARSESLEPRPAPMSANGLGVLLKALAVAVGTYHGLVGLLALFLYRTGPEPWDVLIMSAALVSTPAALVLSAWGARRFAAAWLALAALVWAVSGYRGDRKSVV